MREAAGGAALRDQALPVRQAAGALAASDPNRHIYIYTHVYNNNHNNNTNNDDHTNNDNDDDETNYDNDANINTKQVNTKLDSAMENGNGEVYARAMVLLLLLTMMTMPRGKECPSNELVMVALGRSGGRPRTSSR